MALTPSFTFPSNTMDISFRVLHRTLVIKVYGVFDYAKSLKLCELLRGAKIRKYSNVLFNLAHISTIDSSGLGLMASVARQVERRGGRIKVVHPPHHLHDVLELVRIPGLESPNAALRVA